MTGTARHASSSVTEDAAESQRDCDVRAVHANTGRSWITGGVRIGCNSMLVGPVDVLVGDFRINSTSCTLGNAHQEEHPYDS